MRNCRRSETKMVTNVLAKNQEVLLTVKRIPPHAKRG